MPENRETIELKGAKRYVRRDERGHFTEDQTKVGRSELSQRLIGSSLFGRNCAPRLYALATTNECMVANRI
jgi:hypothetical protein